MAYTKYHNAWADYPATTTPLDAAGLDHIEQGIADGRAASAIDITDSGTYFTGTEVETALQEVGAALAVKASTADAILKSLVDANGDLIVGTADNTVARLAKGSTGQVLSVSADGSLYWKAESGGGSTSAVTALPGSPSDGDEVLFMDSLTVPTYTWHLRYISGKASNKWQFIGGSPMVAAVTASEATTSTSYANLTTSGPSLTLPVAGDYQITYGAMINGGSDNAQPVASFATSAAASDTDRIEGAPISAEQTYMSPSRSVKKTGLTAAAVTMKYKVTSAGSGTFALRWLNIIPIAIGG
jgi:hypothetical protein